MRRVSKQGLGFLRAAKRIQSRPMANHLQHGNETTPSEGHDDKVLLDYGGPPLPSTRGCSRVMFLQRPCLSPVTPLAESLSGLADCFTLLTLANPRLPCPMFCDQRSPSRLWGLIRDRRLVAEWQAGGVRVIEQNALYIRLPQCLHCVCTTTISVQLQRSFAFAYIFFFLAGLVSSLHQTSHSLKHHSTIQLHTAPSGHIHDSTTFSTIFSTKHSHHVCQVHNRGSCCALRLCQWSYDHAVTCTIQRRQGRQRPHHSSPVPLQVQPWFHRI